MQDLLRYEKRGVSSVKEEVHQAIRKLDKGLFPDAVLKVLPDVLGGDLSYCNILHSDGAGTKAALAYSYWKEKNDLSVWKGIAQDAIVMNIDDLLCAGVTDHLIVSLIINRNKYRIPAEVLSAIIQGAEDFIKHLQKQGIDIFFAGGETADLSDIVSTISVDVSVSCRMKRNEVIRTSGIRHGDVIVGLSSFGRAAYENAYNSGIGSNGLTSARHDVLNRTVAEKYPETYDHSMPSELVYSGKMNLFDTIQIEHKDGGKKQYTDTGKLLLSPSRTYFPLMKNVIAEFRKEIHGIVHCTGGGQTKILNYIGPLKISKDAMFPIPQVFRMIKNQSNTSWKEMFSVFNMGHRMEIYCDANTAGKIIDKAGKYKIDAKIIGRCESAEKKSLVIRNLYGDFHYE